MVAGNRLPDGMASFPTQMNKIDNSACKMNVLHNASKVCSGVTFCYYSDDICEWENKMTVSKYMLHPVLQWPTEGGFGGSKPLPRNSEGPRKLWQTEADFENC